MGLILDSSVVIAAERRGDTVEQLIENIVKATGDQTKNGALVRLPDEPPGDVKRDGGEPRIRALLQSGRSGAIWEWGFSPGIPQGLKPGLLKGIIRPG